MNNLDIYDKVRVVPSEAQKQITGGRLKNMTDINPMWRIKALTEQFGVCGFGWKYEIVEKRLESGANNEISAFVDIKLYIKANGEWSDPIPGTGGSSFVANESKGLYTSDECFKMALTDAISVSCKALGFGADVYWEKDRTKYSGGSKEGDRSNSNPQQPSNKKLSEAQVKRAFAIALKSNISPEKVKEWIVKQYNKTSVEDLTKAEYDVLCAALEKK